MSTRNGAIRDDCGQTLVESALSVALLLTFLFGIIAGGMMLYTYHYMSFAARIASRYAIVRGSACDGSGGMPDCPNVTSNQVQTYVRTVHYAGIDASQTTVTVTWPNPKTVNDPKGNNPGDPVNVTVQYPFLFAVPFVNGGTVNLHSTSQMVISQ
jgi:Flp pilus assembly protein TadG